VIKENMLYEDVEIGETFLSPERTISKEDILRFAEVTGDDHPLHIDEEFCRQSGYDSLIAHGLFGVALMEGLKNKLKIYERTSIGSLGWNNIKFLKPLLPGDTVHLEIRFANKRRSSKPKRGVVSEEIKLVNQTGDVLSQGEHHTLMIAGE
jgi:acyl dehydratase